MDSLLANVCACVVRVMHQNEARLRGYYCGQYRNFKVKLTESLLLIVQTQVVSVPDNNGLYLG